jgi:hypothetical protein
MAKVVHMKYTTYLLWRVRSQLKIEMDYILIIGFFFAGNILIIG